MKPIILVAAVAGALGIWAGFNGWQSTAITTTIHAGVALVIGGNLLVCSWVWSRAKPGSGDAMVLPTVILLSAAILVGILPRLFWPSADGVHMASSIASAAIVTVIAVVQSRKRRRLRDQARPV